MYYDIRDGAFSSGSLDYSTVITVNEWFHVAMVYNGDGAGDSDKFKLYIDGSLITMSYANTLPSATHSTCGSANFRIADTTGTGIAKWIGLINDVAIFETALTSGEVGTIYNSGVPTDLSGESGLVAYWRFEEGSGTSVTDHSDNSHTGTITNATYDTDVPE